MPIWTYSKEKIFFYSFSKPLFSPTTAFLIKPVKKMPCWLHVKFRFDTKNELTEAPKGIRIKEQYKRNFDIFSTGGDTMLLLRTFNDRIGRK